MENFEKIIGPVWANEGINDGNPTGYANIPGDTGGETKWGISSKAWQGKDGKPGLNILYPDFPKTVVGLSRDQALAIYQKSYYKPWMDSLDSTTAFLLLDCEVNQGISEIVLQRAAEVKVDGNIGPNTLMAVKRLMRDIPKLNEEIIWQRLMAYKNISVSNSDNQRFLVKLWIPRLNTCRKVIKTLI